MICQAGIVKNIKNFSPGRLGQCFLMTVLLSFLVFSCKNTPSTQNNVFSDTQRQQVSGGIAEEIRTLTETGVLSSMLQALEIIRVRNLSGVDFGRMMNGINTLIIRLVYPDSLAVLPAVDLPQTYRYTQIIRDGERGNYVKPPEASTDFFEHILPFLTIAKLLPGQGLPGDISSQDIIRVLDKAEEIRPNSVLPSYFKGLLYERLNNLREAERAYRKAYEISGEFYPSQISIARIIRLSGNPAQAAEAFSDLIIRYPDSREIKRELAVSLFETRDWPRALPAIDEILQTDPRDGDFLLMKALLLLEQMQYSQSNAVLDTYAPINPNNRLYLYLRARVQAEGNRNRDSAMNYLRAILRTSPNDEEALILAVTLLMESTRPADEIESKELLDRLRRIAGNSVNVLSLCLRDAVRRESWQEAQGFLNRVLAIRRTVQDLTDGYHIERNLGNNTRALSFARELFERDTSNNDNTLIYISALIDNARRDEALRLLNSRMGSVSRGAQLSRYYFLRSRLQTNDEAISGDLRSSLFEDPKNLEANIGLFEYHIRRREERRAATYLRNALSIAPDNPAVRRYEREYASLLQRN